MGRRISKEIDFMGAVYRMCSERLDNYVIVKCHRFEGGYMRELGSRGSVIDHLHADTKSTEVLLQGLFS